MTWGRINPNDDPYKHIRYSNERFPALFEHYQKHTAEFPVKRSLIVCPSINRAWALADYFRERGVNAITLTSEERLDDPVAFQDQYEAWKTGRWREGSPLSGEPIPEAVMGVQIFNEGIDVPGINFLMLWAYTFSSLRFMQWIGRGLRPALGKTHLTVLDAAGLYRDFNLRKLLESFTGLGSKIEGVNASGGTRIEELENEGISLDSRVRSVLADRFSMLPEYLEFEYQEYSLIPARELVQLDQFIANRTGFESPRALRDYLERFMQELASSELTAEKARSFHDHFRPAFFSIIYREEDGNRIPAGGPSAIVFNRIYDLLQQVDEKSSDQYIYALFPEFDPKAALLLRTRSQNLKELRNRVFRLTVPDMVRKLIEDCLLNRNVKLDITAQRHLAIDRHDLELSEGERVLLDLDMAEGRKSTQRWKDEKFLVGSRFVKIDYREDYQMPAMRSYLAHPAIHGKLQEEDFTLDTANFISLLYRKGLIPPETNVIRFYRELKAAAKGYAQAVQAGDQDETTRMRMGLNELISTKSISSLFSLHELTPAQVNVLWDVGGRVNAALRVESRYAPLETAALRKNLEGLILKAGLIWTHEIPEAGGIKIWAEQVVPASESRNIEISLRSLIPSTPIAFPGSALLIQLRQLHGIPHAILSNETISQLASCYSELPPTARSMFLEGAVKALEFAAVCSSGEPVYVFPKDKPGETFFRDLFVRVLDSTTWDAVGQVDVITQKRGARPLDFCFDDIKESRIGFLDSAMVQELRKSQSGLRHLARLPQLYLAYHDYQTDLLPSYEVALEKFNNYGPSSSSARMAFELLQESFQQLMEKGIWRRKFLPYLQSLFKILESDEPSMPLNDAQIEHAALYQLVRFNERAGSDDTQLALQGFFTFLHGYRHVLQQAGKAFPAQLKMETETFIHAALDDYWQNLASKAAQSLGPHPAFSKKIAEEANRLKKHGYRADIAFFPRA